MMEEDLIKIWQSAPNQEHVKFEKSRLITEGQVSLDRFHRIMKSATLRATIAALIIVPVFTFYIYILPFTVSKIASGLAVVFAINAFMRFRKAKKNKPKDLTGTYLEYLHKTKNYLLDQKHLMDTALYWSTIPGISICILFFVGLMESPWFTITRAITVCVGLIIVGILLTFLNKWFVVIHITPNLKKVDALISTLEE